MGEICVESSGKLDLKRASKRQEYLTVLDRLIEVSFEKVTSKYCKNSERISWVNVIARLVTAGGTVLRDADLDTIQERLDILEHKTEGTYKNESQNYQQSG